MKAFTSIEQSKKLAEILPLESADMSYRPCREDGGIPDYQLDLCPHKFASWIGFPCWSLAALLSVLPNGKDVSTTLSRGGWKIDPVEYIDKWWCEYEDEDNTTNNFSVSADNPVDACYEMILKLHELKML